MLGGTVNHIIFCGKYLPGMCRSWRWTNNERNRRYFCSADRRNAQTSTGFNGTAVKISLSSGSIIKIESGNLAKLADGSATVTENETTIMATVVSKPKESIESFVPLTVSYRQKAAALGRIPLNFLRRELGHSETEILTSRIIDRSIRPLFPKGFNWETQVICNPLALDGNTFPDVLSINAASAALAVSDVPWDGPVGAVRVTIDKDEVLVNPNKKQLSENALNLILAARCNKLLIMLEGSCNNVQIPDFLKAVKVGIKGCQEIVSKINVLSKMVGKKKQEFTPKHASSEMRSMIEELSQEKLTKIFLNSSYDKISRDLAIQQVREDVMTSIVESFSKEDCAMANEVFHDVCRQVFRDCIFDNKKRCDGREPNDLRPINCQVSLFKPLHGSALFQRGQTQVMCTVSLDSPHSALKMDRVTMLTSGLKEKNFFVHYEFPPFATKEIGRTGPIGRREIGHGALAEKALRANVPKNFPFAIRLTSEVLESNGSSSMATVCAGSLALWDAGIPLESACAGVAMGILTKAAPEEPHDITDHVILTDILGIEDHFGEMDFKVAFTKKSLTAVQMDLKNNGLPIQILGEILFHAKNATGKILTKMASVCSEPRIGDKKNWPVIEKVNVPPQIRLRFLGPGGMNVKKLETETGVEISEEAPGIFSIFAPNAETMEEAKQVIEELLKESLDIQLEFGGIYSATIVEIKNHGVLVSIHPAIPPVLVHLSQLDQKKVSHPSALGMEVGERIDVKYFGRDPVSGTIRLSRKVLQGPPSEVVHSFAKPEQETIPAQPSQQMNVEKPQ